MTNDITATIGCDLGDKTSHVCVLSEDGSVRRASVRTARKAMELFFTRPPAHVVIEVGAHSPWVSALLTALGHRVTVAKPRALKVISQSTNKTDRNVDETLALLGLAYFSLLRPVIQGTAQAQEDISVA